MEHSKPPDSNERIIIGGESESKITQNNHISHDLLHKFDGKSREVRTFIFLINCQYFSDNLIPINFQRKTIVLYQIWTGLAKLIFV